MAVLLALISALAYGTSDFCAGLASRGWAAEPTAAVITAVEVLGTPLEIVVFPGHGPHLAALAWGALAGLGGGGGSLLLYRGLAAGAMAVVGTVSGVLAAVVPVAVGLALGNGLHPAQAVGIAVAVPAIGLVSWQRGGRAAATAIGYGSLAGLGFALLFIGLDRAGTGSGAWPLLPGQSVSLLVVAPFAWRRRAHRPGARQLGLAAVAGLLAAAAAVVFLAASGHGELSIIAVVTSLYPAFTVILARVVLSERWSPLQAVGLLVAAASVVLVSVG